MNNYSLQLDRYKGCLAGLAAGDALGTTVEFQPPGTFEPMDDMVGGGVFGLQAGEWTDDTSMALCLAESLLESDGFDPKDQMQRYVRWFRDGYWGSTGTCFDIGNATRAALIRYEQTGEPYSGSEDPAAAGNGSIMRLAPVPMLYAGDPLQAIKYARLSSMTTHRAAESVEACALLAVIITTGLRGGTKEQMLSAYEGLNLEGFSDALKEVAGGSYKRKSPPDIVGSGYVVPSLEASLWAFYHSSSFEEGALLAVNLGNDADTTGAIYGQIAGAYYGYEGIPEVWRSKLARGEAINKLAQKLYDAASLGEKSLHISHNQTQFEELAQIIAESNQIVYFGGAGTSTESGIPDFRSADGLYQESYGRMFAPEEILSRDFFMEHTAEFYDFYRSKMVHPHAQPNKAHMALAELERRGKLRAVITQNIDGLHQLAGSRNVLELHGSVQRNSCMKCQASYPLAAVLDEGQAVPCCERCGGIIKPDVVLYQESLNMDILEQAADWIAKADTLIVGGTSLTVQPAAGLVRLYKGKRLILINRDATALDKLANYRFSEKIGEVLSAVL